MENYSEVDVPNRPIWYRPNNTRKDVLMVRNSLTDRLEEFVPHEGNRVRWYTCGPTVYNVCHMGHARAYLTFDILRRIMTDYLHYDVEYQVNITDVDDKIILGARRKLLVEQYIASKPSGQDIVSRVTGTLLAEIAKAEGKLSQLQQELKSITSNSKRTNELEEQIKMQALKLNTWRTFEEDLNNTDVNDLDKVIKVCAPSEALGISLDAERGSSVNDNDVFERHARFYEESFMRDMQRLGVRPPDLYTRVTEYVPKIIDYCAKLVELGFAYESNGSVYLDTKSFEKAGHTYRKLKPFSGATSKEELEEGEGVLCGNASEKRDPTRDFVLWKRSKENTGEPGWESPWGRGRPGWHIECSVVASDVLGSHIDIHAGGEDLKFPHHDNELAQSEAFHNCQQWVNYFFHAGHLHIKGLKMSKSLKNFVTIDEALQYSTARRLRILFLIQPWDGHFTYSEASLEEARSKEKRLSEFLGSMKIMERDLIQTWLKKVINAPTVHENTFREVLATRKQQCHSAILNNFDTPTCLEGLLGIISAFYEYKEVAKEDIAFPICLDAARYINKILQVFGVDFSISGDGEESSGGNREEIVSPIINGLVAFREEIKGIVQNSNDNPKETKMKILKACDKLRDETLIEQGVSLKDDENGKGVWYLRDSKELKAEIAEKKQKIEAELLFKVQKKIQTLQNDISEVEEMIRNSDLSTLFRTSEYSAWDENGLPTTDASGEPVSQNKLKALKKQLDGQKEKWGKKLLKVNGSPQEYLVLKRKELEKLISGEGSISSVVTVDTTFTVNGEIFRTNIKSLVGKSFSNTIDYFSFLNSN